MQQFRLCLCLTAFLAVAPVSRSSDGAEQTVGNHRFKLPDGFSIERAAGPPLVNRPICGDFDPRGRLYVADSSGSNDKISEQIEEKPHRIVRLEDTDGNGRFDKSVVFVDRISFPEGTLWHDGSLYVTAVPYIWKFTDTDGDGAADRREVWFDGQTVTGCANDLHGPFLGPDGWIYWCKGAFAEQTHPLTDGSVLKSRAAHIFRRHPSGGPVEVVMTGGMDNPVELAFTPGGERIFTTTFLVHPSNPQGQRDGLIHAIYGGVYGKNHNVIDDHPRTGELMPPLVHLGAAAPSGLARLKGDEFGPTYRDNLLATLFNMRKVTRHRLSPRGASYACETSDFLVSDNLDFHPTDVIEDADGSVLVIDTGGWYKLCCPTSQLWKPDVLGAIYRVRRDGAHGVRDPRGLDLQWRDASASALAQRLSDPRPAVRNRVAGMLARRGADAVQPVERQLRSGSARTRRAAVWTLGRLDGPEALEAVVGRLGDPDAGVRQAALHVLSLRRGVPHESAIRNLLNSESAHNRRAAAEALGRLGGSDSVVALFEAVPAGEKRILEHSVLYALIELDRPDAVRPYLNSRDPRRRRAALIALSQMDSGDLQVEQVADMTTDAHRQVRGQAWKILQRRGDGIGVVTELLREKLERPRSEDETWQRLSSFIDHTKVRSMIGELIVSEKLGGPEFDRVCSIANAAGVKTIPGSWFEPLLERLRSEHPERVESAVSLLRTASETELSEPVVKALTAISRRPSLTSGVRLDALRLLLGRQSTISAEAEVLITSHLTADQPTSLRSRAVDIVTKLPPSHEVAKAVFAALPDVGPMELPQLVEHFAGSGDPALGRRLVDALADASALTSLRPESLLGWLESFGDEVVRQAAPLAERIRSENEGRLQKLQRVLALYDTADVRRGQQVFHSSEASCVSCHIVGYLGGRVGPSLTRIGRIRSERDLLESILFPSASLVRSYEPTLVLTIDGQVLNGLVTGETTEAVTLRVDAEREIEIPKREIESRRVSDVSIMPAGLDKQLSEQELADLVKFLKESS